MGIKRIALCTAQVPFTQGGAEIHVDSLRRELVRRGFQVEVIRLPFKWYPKVEILKSCLAWRLIDLTESDGKKIDLVIATKFPSYVVKHPNKITWLVHQFRSAYDLHGTKYSDFSNDSESRQIREMIRQIDNRTLKESRRIYTISKNVAARLAKYNGLTGEPLYPPPMHDGLYRNDAYGDYILSVSRLNPIKRVGLLIEAMQYIKSGARCVIVGEGPQEEKLKKLAHQLGVTENVSFLGYVDDNKLIELYANCFSVFFAPFDEDYGYITLEAFKSRKPVLTTTDSGGVLEFVEDNYNGYVVDKDPKQIAAKFDYLFNNRTVCERFGTRGYDKVKDIQWDSVIEKLTLTL